MKKLFSILLVLAMVLTLAPMAFASEEAGIEEEAIDENIIDEPVEEPALDGEDTINAWIQDGKLYWDKVPGANCYQIYYYLANSLNGMVYNSDGKYNLIYEDTMPFDLQAYFKSNDELTQTIYVRVEAYYLRASGTLEELAASDLLNYYFENLEAYLETPDAWWDGTTICWENLDLSRFAFTDNQLRVYIELYENGKKLTDIRKHFSETDKSWDVSTYIEMLDRNYHFKLWFEADSGKDLSWIYTSEDITGEKLKAGYNSAEYTVTFITDYGTAPAAQTVKHGSTVTKPPDPVDPSGEKVFQSWATRSIRYFSGQWTFTYRKYDFDQAVTSDRTLYAQWIDASDFTFTKQPVSGTAKKSEGYTYSFATSVTPDAIYLEIWYPEMAAWSAEKLSDEVTSWTEDYYSFFAEDNVSRYRIMAMKGSATIYSDEFTVTWTDSDSAKPTVTIASDGKSAKVTGDWTGLYARVALVLDNGGVSGLYVTQATINPDGTIIIPAFMVPGLTVKGVNVALVPTLADIQSTTPNVEAMATKMLST